MDMTFLKSEHLLSTYYVLDMVLNNCTWIISFDSAQNCMQKELFPMRNLSLVVWVTGPGSQSWKGTDAGFEPRSRFQGTSNERERTPERLHRGMASLPEWWRAAVFQAPKSWEKEPRGREKQLRRAAGCTACPVQELRCVCAVGLGWRMAES